MPTVRSGEADLYYERHGAGPALVFAHGAGGNTLSWWQQVPHFARRHTVVTFDHRGFGRSTCPETAFHPRHFASDVLAVLDAEGVGSAALVCQSMGGWTGVRLALEAPERVRALVLCGTPGGVATREVLEAAANVGARAGQEGIRGSAALAPDYPEREPAMAFLYDQIAARNDGLEAARHLGKLFEPEVRVPEEALRSLRMPVRFVAGELDQLFPPAALRSVAALVPGAGFSLLPGLGHSTYFEDAPAFNLLVEDFLADPDS